MAGLGSRFASVGFVKPKPFIDVAGKPMIVRVLDNLYYPEANYILIARKEHLEKEKLLVAQIEKDYNVSFIGIEKLTEGTACTILYARNLIDNETPLLIANSDQIVDVKIQDFIDDGLERNLDGSILTFEDETRNSKWSFAKLDEENLVIEVKEKQAISKYATVGIYMFKSGADFVDSAIQMFIENDRVNNEFYTCPIYNYLIRKGDKIGVYQISPNAMHGIGTPEDLDLFLSTLK